MTDTPLTLLQIITDLADTGSAGRITPAIIRQAFEGELNIVPAIVSAAGTTQGTATVLTSQFNIITNVAPGTGVVATAGYTVIWNTGPGTLLVYPISGAQLGSIVGTNNPIAVPSNNSLEINMTSTTQGYIVGESVPTPPIQASNAGFTSLALFDDFTTTTTITADFTKTSGFLWYPGVSGMVSPTNYQILTTTNAAGISAGNTSGGANPSPAGGILQINGDASMSFNDIFQGLPNGQTVAQNSFKHCYIECYFQFNPTNVGSNGWPSFWTWALPEAGNINNPVEIDIMEAGSAGSAPTTPGGWTIHDQGGGFSAAAVVDARYLAITGANLITNPLTTGAATGSPGTIPTGWQIGTVTGISTQVVNIGPYIDVRWHGTASAGGNLSLNPTGAGGWTATTSTFYSFEWNVSLVGGSLANINSFSLDMQDQIGTSYNSSIAGSAFTPTATQITYHADGKSSATSINAVGAYFIAGITNGAVVDVTLRFYNPIGRKAVLDAEWHTYGLLWNGAGGVGTLDFYFDNVHVGGPITTGIGNQVIDLERTQGLYITMGTGLSAPIYIDWVKVWTQP